MFNKLKSNYNLSNVLVKVFLVLAVVLSTWQTSLGILYYAMPTQAANMMTALNGAAKVIIAVMTSLIMGVILMFLLPFLTNVFLNASKIHNVPRAEYCLLVNLFTAIGFFVCGLLNLINLITPVFMVWGSVIYPFVVTLGLFVAFYFVTAKMYFNDVTKLHYFKCVLVVAVIVLALEVL